MSDSSHLQRVTLLLAAVSTVLMQVALENRDPGTGLVLLGASVALAVGLRLVPSWRKAEVWSLAAVARLMLVMFLPLVWDAATRAMLGVGAPYEVQLACVLRNLMLALIASPNLPKAIGHAALASLFLTVFGYLWSSGPVSVTLLAVYALLGTWWLLAAHWEQLGGRFADSAESALPLRPAVGAGLALVLLASLLLPIAGRSTVTTALAGFFPSSGGTELSDPFAHGGVGDGDQMVAAKDQASSFGPIDSDLFLESEMPSLYDAFNEFSEALPNKKKRLRRAIPLAPSQMQTNHDRRGTTQQANREFSTVRQATPPQRATEDRLSAALLLVKGRTPLHLALETYDRWDGRSLVASHSSEAVATRLGDPDEQGRRWLELSVARPPEIDAATEASQVRVVNLKTDRVPTPAGATSVTMKGLHDRKMFASADDGSLSMSVEHVPQLTIFEFRSALRDRSAAPTIARTSVPDASSEVGRLAAEWVEGVPTGWKQVEAVTDRLRQGYAHDREAMVPASAEDAVEHFLLEAKRGPDYLFAASAAVLLRSLGYDTRVRSGFYADPDRYRRSSQLTPVHLEDAHFWVEVRTDSGLRSSEQGDALSGVWVAIEPTPGYELLYAPETMFAWALRQVAAWAGIVRSNPSISGCLLLVGGLCLMGRRKLLDGVLLGWWSVRSRTAGAGGLARLTLRLLEWRAWAYRQSRPVGASLGRWEALQSQDEFVALVSWALYGASPAAPLDNASARSACRRAVRTRFQSAGPTLLWMPRLSDHPKKESRCKL